MAQAAGGEVTKLTIKRGVQPPLLRIFAGISNVAQTLDHPKSVCITSGIDGKHSTTSLHFQLAALDVRTRTFRTLADKRAFAQAVREELGKDYDVVLERTHLHVEFDPK
jgi:hypothetical protein